MLKMAKKQLESALPYANIDSESWERLQYPDKILQASIPCRHDDGTLRSTKLTGVNMIQRLVPRRVVSDTTQTWIEITLRLSPSG